MNNANTPLADQQHDATSFLVALYDGMDGALLVNIAAIDDVSCEFDCLTLDKLRHENELEHFISRHQAKQRNIYYGLNPLQRRPKNGKAAKSDVSKYIWFVHADCDPPKSVQNLKSWRLAKCDQLMRYNLSALVDSGGGYQAIMRLSQPVTQNRAEEINRLFVRSDLHADAAATDVTRLLRLPGTKNYPGKVKRERGRSPADAKSLRLTDLTFKPDSFDGDDLDDLPVSHHVKHTIRTGQHLDDPAKYPSPSEARMAVVVSMINSHVPRERIFEILSDSRYPLFGDDNKRKPKWINQEIDRIHDATVPQWVRELNDDYFVTMTGNQARVMRCRYDENLRRQRWDSMSFTAFSQFYANRYVPNPNQHGRAQQVQMGSAWLSHPQRRTYSAVVMRPDAGPVVDDCYNLWRGFSVEPKPGNCVRLKAHMRAVLCRGNKDHFKYLWNWLARAVQEPHKQAEVAIVMQGARGTGKGVFVRAFGELFGSHFLHITSSKHLVGNFNAHLRDTILLFCDEALWAGDRAAASVLKGLVTEPVVPIEGKGVDVELGPNMLHILMASNSDWVIPAGAQERRFFVLKVSDKYAQNHRYFGRLLKQLDQGGREAFLHELLTTDLAGWNPRLVPQTEGLRDQQIRSLDPLESFMLQCLCDRMFTDKFGWNDPVPRQLLYQQYINHARAMGSRYTASPTAFGRTLKRWGVTAKRPWVAGWEDEKVRDKFHSGYGYVFKSIDECRELFVTDMGWDDWQWPEDHRDAKPDPKF